MVSKLVYCVATFLLLFPSLSGGLTSEEYVTLTDSQKTALDELRSRVKDKLPEKLRGDWHLIRFLREVDFRVNSAERMMLNVARWRVSNNIDNILDEDFTDFDEELEIVFPGCDKDGKPIMSADVTGVDFRRNMISGKGPRLLRYMDRIFEEGVDRLIKMQQDGQNVTQITFIVDAANFSPVTQACPICIPIYFYAFFTLQTNFPGLIHKFVAVNVPSYATPLWNIIRPLLHPRLKEVFHIFGKNKAEWTKFLFQEIDPSQLSPQFGGTKPFVIDTKDLRQSGKVFRCNMTLDDLYTSMEWKLE